MNHHLDDGRLQALLDGELSMGEDREAREHIAGCIDCRDQITELREANSSLVTALRHLDPPRARGGVEAAPRLAPAPRVSRRPARWRGIGLARAAALLLTVSAAASATIPGSPVRGWLLDRLDGRATEVAVVQPDPAASRTEAMSAEEAIESGVTVAPEDGALRVIILDVGADVRVVARFVRAPRGGVYASGEAADGRFQAAAGVIEVRGVQGGELRVEIPESTARASVYINGQNYLEKDGDEVVINGDERRMADEARIDFLLRP